MKSKLRMRSYTARRIRDSVNTLPCGLCFYRADGRPILVNRMMNEIAFRVTGRTMINVFEFWDIACRRRIELTSLSGGGDSSENVIQLRFTDDSVWQIRMTAIGTYDASGNEIFQMDAADISRLYRTVSEYNDMNRQLTRQYRKLKEISTETVRLNEEKELLHVKSEIHNEFGECITAMLRRLENGGDKSDSELITSWRDVIAKFSNIAGSSGDSPPAPEEELMRVAEMINCGVVFEGRMPESIRDRQLLCTAVREALSNAVRHSGADSIRIVLTDDEDGLSAEISDNGSNYPESIREGTGLTNLRKRLEEAGVLLSIACESGRGVVLRLRFPRGDENDV